MTELNLSPQLKLPIDAVTQTFAILGKRGRGKTNTAVVLAEELIGTGLPVWIVDTVGAWWGLRSSADGKKPGLPVVVFGGDHADVPLEETAGTLIARVLIEKQIPAIIDTSGFSKAGARRFLTAFITEIYRRNRTPVHVIFDEADELAPQRPGADGIKLLGAMEDFVRRGRLRGLGCTLVTQRPAVLHKDVLTQAEVLVSMGMTGPRDVAAINEWVQLHADEGQAKLVRETLASLPVGTAWVWSPEWLGILEKVAIRPRHTFDSSATPKVGQARIVPQKRAEIDLEQLGAEIAATADKAKDDNPTELRRQLADRHRRITTLERELHAAGLEISELRNQNTTRDVDALIATLDQLSSELRFLSDPIHEIKNQIGDKILQAEILIGALSGAGQDAAADEWIPPHHLTPPAPRESPAAATPVPSAGDAPVTDTQFQLGKAHRAILTALATHGTLPHKRLAILSGYTSTSSGFKNPLARLRAAGYAIGGGEAISITDQGLAALGDYTPLPAGQALVDFWMASPHLGKAHRAILTVLLERWPNPTTHTDLAFATGYEPTSSGFKNPLARLRSLELANGNGSAITASDELGKAAHA